MLKNSRYGNYLTQTIEFPGPFRGLHDLYAMTNSRYYTVSNYDGIVKRISNPLVLL